MPVGRLTFGLRPAAMSSSVTAISPRRSAPGAPAGPPRPRRRSRRTPSARRSSSPTPPPPPDWKVRAPPGPLVKRKVRAAAASAASEAGKDVLEHARGRCSRSRRLGRPRGAFEALEAGLALGVDLAAVEFCALVLVAQNLVGGVDLGELRLRLLVAGVLVRMVLLGELSVGALDLRLAGGAADTQHVIGIAHSHLIRRGSSSETAEIWWESAENASLAGRVRSGLPGSARRSARPAARRPTGRHRRNRNARRRCWSRWC